MKLIDKDDYKLAAETLRKGGIIAFPTETVFGLGVIYDNKEAYDRLISVKRRPENKPFTIMCSSKDDIENYGYVNENAKKLIEAFVPGEITLILKAKPGLPSWTVSNEGTVGVRVPDDKFIQKMIHEVGKPLLVPSANRSGEKPANSSSEVLSIFKDELDLVVKGESKSGVPSTIVMLLDDVKIIREGKISKDLILSKVS